jgi:DNA primase
LTDAATVRRALSDPRALCEALGIAKEAKRQACGLLVLCPWHAERTPSCSVTLAGDGTIRVRCFACDATGDALSLVAAVRGLDLATQFDRVLDEAAELAGSDREPRRQKPELRHVEAAAYAALAARLCELCPWTEDADGYAYVERRLLVISGSHAGLAVLPPRAEQAALLARLCETFELETLARAGLVKRDGAGKPDLAAFTHPENRLVIPWRGFDGSIAILQRRRLDDERSGKYVFPAGMKPALPFGAERLRASDAGRTITWCEGALDVLALRTLDERDGSNLLPLGIPGTSAWRTDWARYCCGRDVFVALDADESGDAAAERISADLYAHGARSVRRLRPRHGCKDWAELLAHEVSTRAGAAT